MRAFHISVAILSFLLVFVSLVRAADEQPGDEALDNMNDAVHQAAAKPEVYNALEIKNGETLTIPADGSGNSIPDSAQQ